MLDKIYLIMKRIFFITTIIFFCFACKDDQKDDLAKTLNKPVVDLPESLQQLANEIKRDSSNINKQLDLVQQLDSLGFQSKALELLDKLISKDSLNNEYWLKRGQLCKVLEDTPSAIKAFHYAARIYPNPISLMELANLYSETKNQKTISICNQLMKMHPDGSYDAQANFFVGVYYSKLNDLNNAINHFNLCIEKDFHFDDAYIEKGYLLYNNKKLDAALKVFQQLVAMNQTSADGYYWIGKIYETLNKKNEALKNYQKALVFNDQLKEASEAINRINSK